MQFSDIAAKLDIEKHHITVTNVNQRNNRNITAINFLVRWLDNKSNHCRFIIVSSSVYNI